MLTAEATLKTHTHGTLLSRKTVTGATQQALEVSAEAWAQQKLHDLGYRSIPSAEGYSHRNGTRKHYDWGPIIFTLEYMEGL